MFTDCPSCGRLFRVRAAQLGAAEGWVKCGYCAQLFQALERLHDAPLLRSVPQGAGAEPVAGPASQAEAEPPAADSAAPAKSGQPAAAAPAQEPPDPITKVPATRELSPPQPDPAPAAAADPREDKEFLSGLRPASTGARSKETTASARIIWGSMALILSALAVAQLAWYNRDWMLRAYPALTPWVVKICEHRQCEPIRFRDVSAIRLLNEEIKPHPRYRDALLASASIVNLAKFIQRYPDLELLVFGDDGKILAQGIFSPEQYLHRPPEPGSGLSSHVPVDVTLELTAPAEEASSFQFRFR